MQESVNDNSFLDWIVGLSPAFIIGLAMGYFLKKSFKIFLFVFGAIAIISLALSSQGFAELNLDSLKPVVELSKDAFVWLAKLAEGGLGNMTANGVSGLAGFALGFKMG